MTEFKDITLEKVCGDISTRNRGRALIGLSFNKDREGGNYSLFILNEEFDIHHEKLFTEKKRCN